MSIKPIIEQPPLDTKLFFQPHYPGAQGLQLSTSMTIAEANAALKEAIQVYNGFFVLEEPPQEGKPGSIVIVNLRHYSMASASTGVNQTKLHTATSLPPEPKR